MVEAVINAEGLTKKYGDFTAVDHINLTIDRGEVFGLLGPNGAGKTTTILMLLGLSEPTEGKAQVVGLDPARQPLEVKARVGYLPDNVGFYPTLTGRENLEYTARLNRVPSGDIDERVDSALDRVGLSTRADSPAGTYSRGMRQRLGIADALVKEPSVLILDEPTIGIDPEGVKDILKLISSLAKETGVTVMLSSHLLYQVQEVCDRVGIFYRGRLVADGPVHELAHRHAPDEIAVEISTTQWEQAGTALSAIPGVMRIDREQEHWVVYANRDVRPDIGRVFAEQGIPLLHLRRRGEALDEIYSRYFQGDGDGPSDG